MFLKRWGRVLILTNVALGAMFALLSCGSPDTSPKPTVTRMSAANAPSQSTQAGASGTTATSGGEAPTTASTSASESEPTTASTASGESTQNDAALVTKGTQLFSQFACVGCHSTSGQILVGPALNGIYGTQTKLTDGQTVTVDDAYLQESILDPDAKIVEGFSPGIMSGTVASFEGQIRQDDNLAALIAYIKSLD